MWLFQIDRELKRLHCDTSDINNDIYIEKKSRCAESSKSSRPINLYRLVALPRWPLSHGRFTPGHFALIMGLDISLRKTRNIPSLSNQFMFLFSPGYKHGTNRMYNTYLTNTCNMAEIVIIILLGKQQKNKSSQKAMSFEKRNIQFDSDYIFSPLASRL